VRAIIARQCFTQTLGQISLYVSCFSVLPFIFA